MPLGRPLRRAPLRVLHGGDLPGLRRVRSTTGHRRPRAVRGLALAAQPGRRAAPLGSGGRSASVSRARPRPGAGARLRPRTVPLDRRGQRGVRSHRGQGGGAPAPGAWGRAMGAAARGGAGAVGARRAAAAGGALLCLAIALLAGCSADDRRDGGPGHLRAPERDAAAATRLLGLRPVAQRPAPRRGARRRPFDHQVPVQDAHWGQVGHRPDAVTTYEYQACGKEPAFERLLLRGARRHRLHHADVQDGRPSSCPPGSARRRCSTG